MLTRVTPSELFLLALFVILTVLYLAWRVGRTDHHAPLLVVRVGGLLTKSPWRAHHADRQKLYGPVPRGVAEETINDRCGTDLLPMKRNAIEIWTIMISRSTGNYKIPLWVESRP